MEKHTIRKMKKVLVTICFMALLCGCINDKKPDFIVSDEEILEKFISEDNYSIVDVRTKEEYEEGHVVGAIHIPYDEIDENIGLDKGKSIIVYCQEGDESGIVCDKLRALGYEVFDLGTYDAITLEKE